MVEASSSDQVEVVSSQVETSAAAAVSSKSPSNDPVQMPNLDSFAAKLSNFAVVLSEKAKSRPVTVGSVGEIEAAITIKKVGRHLSLSGYSIIGRKGDTQFPTYL